MPSFCFKELHIYENLENGSKDMSHKRPHGVADHALT